MGQRTLISDPLAFFISFMELFEQAIKHLNPQTSYGIQIDGNPAWLFQAQWGFVTIDFSIGVNPL
jgi:hypothetical protein